MVLGVRGEYDGDMNVCVEGTDEVYGVCGSGVEMEGNGSVKGCILFQLYMF